MTAHRDPRHRCSSPACRSRRARRRRPSTGRPRRRSTTWSSLDAALAELAGIDPGRGDRASSRRRPAGRAHLECRRHDPRAQTSTTTSTAVLGRRRRGVPARRGRLGAASQHRHARRRRRAQRQDRAHGRRRADRAGAVLGARRVLLPAGHAGCRCGRRGEGPLRDPVHGPGHGRWCGRSDQRADGRARGLATSISRSAAATPTPSSTCAPPNAGDGFGLQGEYVEAAHRRLEAARWRRRHRLPTRTTSSLWLRRDETEAETASTCAPGTPTSALDETYLGLTDADLAASPDASLPRQRRRPDELEPRAAARRLPPRATSRA
jgi:hypothetical protein